MITKSNIATRYLCEKYRFFLAVDGVNYLPIRPAKKVIIQGSQDENCADHRKKTTEWIIKKSENSNIYDSFLLKIKSPSTLTSTIKAKICLYDDFETLTSTEFEGYIPLSSIKPDEDVGVIEFTPEELSAYDWWDIHKTDEKDLVSSDNVALFSNELWIQDTSYSIDFYIPGRSDCANPPTNCVMIDADVDVPMWKAGIGYTKPGPFENEWNLGQWVRHPNAYPPPYQNKLYRCIKNHTSVAGNSMGANEPGLDGNSWHEYWLPYDYSPYTNFLWQVRQQRAEFALPYFVKGNGVYQGNFTGLIPGEEGATNCPDNMYCRALSAPTTGNSRICEYGNLKLFEAIDYLLTGSGLTFQSQFFSLATNPVTGIASRVRNILLSHKAYLMATNDDETKGNVSLENLINALCTLFNCKWHIDDTAHHLIVEHRSYYDAGRAYGGTPVIYAYLNNTTDYPLKYQTVFDRNGNSTDKSYNFDNKSPQKETFELSETADAISEILYSSLFAKSGEIEKHTVDGFTTDLLFVIQNPDDASEDQFCIVAANEYESVYRKNVTIGMSSSVLYNRPNGDLFFDNLIRDYHLHGRFFKTGKINADAVATTFLSQRPSKKQRQIFFPRLSTESYDPLELIRTNLGSGTVQEYELDTETDYIKVTLLYPID